MAGRRKSALADLRTQGPMSGKPDIGGWTAPLVQHPAGATAGPSPFEGRAVRGRLRVTGMVCLRRKKPSPYFNSGVQPNSRACSPMA
jgi:hypothetical protein